MLKQRAEECHQSGQHGEPGRRSGQRSAPAAKRRDRENNREGLDHLDK
jgi:hypothetical protein